MNSHPKAPACHKSGITSARLKFNALFEILTTEAKACDVGLLVRKAGDPMVNNFEEGRDATVKERGKWLIRKMTECRLGRWDSVTLACLFPKDMETIQSALAKGGAK